VLSLSKHMPHAPRFDRLSTNAQVDRIDPSAN